MDLDSINKSNNEPDISSDLAEKLGIPAGLPSYIQVGEPGELKKYEERPVILTKELANYEITEEELEMLVRYKNEDYFMFSTMLHKISLFKYSMPRYGYAYHNFPDSKGIIDFFEKVYSAMCKYSKKNSKTMKIYRIGSQLFFDEMRDSKKTEGLLSFSKSYPRGLFVQNKGGIVVLEGFLEKGVPRFDFSTFGDSDEEEVLLPPFLNIKFDTEKSMKWLTYPAYDVYISKDSPKRLTNEEKAEMEKLKESIIQSNAARDYYIHWYNLARQSSGAVGDEESVKLRQDFFKWQDKLKRYLQLRYREIECEILYPQLKASDLLEAGIEGVKEMGLNVYQQLIEKIFGFKGPEK